VRQVVTVEDSTTLLFPECPVLWLGICFNINVPCVAYRHNVMRHGSSFHTGRVARSFIEEGKSHLSF